MATAADLTGSTSAVNEQLRGALQRWERTVTEELVRMDVPRRRAHRMATLMISTLEGAIMWARVRRDLGPLNTIITELSPLLNSHMGES